MSSIASDGDPMDRATQPVAAPAAEIEALAKELYAKSGAAQFAIRCEDLARLISELVQKYVGNAGPAATAEFCSSLKLPEQVLARACAAGN